MYTRTGQSPISAVFQADLTARHPGQAGGQSQGSSNVAALGVGEQIYHGAGSAPGATGPRYTGATSQPREFNLNFQNADIREVVQSILGNALGESYTIDPTIAGPVTFSSARPLNREELLTALEIVLQPFGAVVSRSGGIYRVTSEAGAVAGGADFWSASPGYGLTIVPLQFVSARTLIGLIEGFGARPGSVRAEPRNNFLVVLGNSADRQAAVQTALNFDVDWMENQSVAILPLSHTKPETVIPELERIFAAREAEVGSDLIQFMPMQRLRAVLAVSPQATLIERARAWVQRLDTENPDVNADVYVYRVKYRDATRVAELLNGLFAQGGAFIPDAPGAQVTPGSEAVSAVFGAQPGELIAAEAEPAGVPMTGFGAATETVQQAAGPSIRIQADAANNSLVIYADRRTRQQILTALSRVDVPQLQVAINVTMAEIRLGNELRYGVQYFLRNQVRGTEGSVGLFSTIANNIGRDLPGFNFVLGSESSPDIILSAFQGVTDVQVLSSPSLVVVENETARFQVGDQIPIVTRTVTSVEDSQAPIANEIEYRDTGIILQIKPRISENGVVNLDIAQEISSATANSATLTPTISNRRVESTISVVDGQTVLLGGLIGEQTEDSRAGIPGLSRLPGVGAAFRNTSRGGSRTELIILIRPQVIRGSEDAQYVAEELRTRMWRANQAQ